MSWQLADILADLYNGDGDVRRLVSGIGMRPAMIEFDARPLNTWHSVVGEASKREGKREALVDLALVDYPEHPGLLAAKQAPITDVPGRPPATWKRPDNLEKIIAENDLFPIWFLERGLEIARSIGRIRGVEGWTGTAFLIDADRVMTNHHVLPDESSLRGAAFELNAQTDAGGRDLPIKSIPLATDGYVSDATHDWAVARLSEPAEPTWGAISMRAAPVAVGDPVFIIQHPGGQAKQIALGNNRVTHVGVDADAHLVQYVTDTMPGSSGSPVFDRNWNLVALHHSGGWLREPNSKRTLFRNEGILIGSVIAGLADAEAKAKR